MGAGGVPIPTHASPPSGAVSPTPTASGAEQDPAAQRAGDRRLGKVVQNLSDTVTIIDADGLVLYSSAGGVEEALGYPAEFWARRSAFDLAHPDDLEDANAALRRLIRTPGMNQAAEFRARHADGHWETIELNGINLLDDPEVQGVVVTTRNITGRRRAETLLASQAEILELIARGTPLDHTLQALVRMIEEHSEGGRSAVYLATEDGRLRLGAATSASPTAVATADGQAVDAAGPVGRAMVEARPVVVADLDDAPEWTPQRAGLEAEGVRACWTAPVVDLATGEVVGAFGTYYGERRRPTDHEWKSVRIATRLAAIAVDRDRAASRLAQQALYDPLTGLANRTLLMDRLSQAARRADRASIAIGVLFIDLDRFQVVNDSLGHDAGDLLLIEAAARVGASTPTEATLARFGGDEFVVVLEPVGSTDDLVQVARQVAGALREPMQLGGDEVFVTASIGATVSVGGAETAETLLRNADAAVHLAKGRGRDRVEVFDPAMQSQIDDRVFFESDLRRAVARDELVLAYQPTVDLASNGVVGVEALLRWSHPTRGLLWPAQFIPVAEETGAIVPIGAWVLDEAIRQAAAWAAGDHGPRFGLSVNVSARQLASPDLVATVQRALARHRWPAARLALELTETMFIDDSDEILATLRELKDLGVKLSIDDFGQGFSSLAYLSRFPVDLVKIDRAFVADLSPGSEGRAITTAVVRMARDLGLKTVAEGVETRAQATTLRRIGCDWAQGYLYARPLPGAQARRFLGLG